MPDYPIVINKSHYVGGSTFEYRFGTSVEMGNVEVALGSASLFYSWRNITANKANNTFNIIHPTTSAVVVLTLTIPDGGYEIADLNNYLRWYLITNGYYIQNTASGDQTVYCEFRVNPSTYSVEFVSYNLPTALPSGFTAGSAITFPSTTRGPQLTITNANFGRIIGFALGTFPSSAPTVITTVSSTLTPVLSDVNNVAVTLDSSSNPFAPNSKVISAISYAGVSYGRLITYSPNELSFVPQQHGFRQTLRIQLTDQNLQPLQLIDTDITVILILRKVLA